MRENVAVGSAQFLLHSILEFMADKVPEKNSLLLPFLSGGTVLQTLENNFKKTAENVWK